MFITELPKANPRINDSRDVYHGLNDRGLIASKNGEIDDCLAIASLILRSQAQCRASYSINLFENVNMIFQFFSSSRHLGFEDIQAVVNLIGDAGQISGLLTLCTLGNSPVDCGANLHQICILSRNPFASPSFTRQSVETQAIRRCNEASSLTTNEVSFNGFPINSQGFRHKASLSSIVHKVKASMIPRIEDALTLTQGVTTNE